MSWYIHPTKQLKDDELPPELVVTNGNGSIEQAYVPAKTCKMRRDEHGVWHCSSCEDGADKVTGSDGTLDSWNDSWPPNFCPYCGAEVVCE